MPIHSLELANVGPFRRRPDGSGDDGIKLEFDANVNLFIGPNNVGKSTILQALDALVGSGKIVNLFPPTHNAEPGGCDAMGEAPFRLEWTDIVGNRKVLSGDLHGACRYQWGWLLETLNHTIEDQKIEIRSDYWGWSEEKERDEGGYVGYYDPSVRRSDYPMTQSRYEHTLSFIRRRRDSRNRYDEQQQFDKIAQVVNEISAGFPIDLATQSYTDAGYGSYDFFSNTIDGDVVSADLSRGTRSVLDCVYYLVLDMTFYYSESDWANMPGIFIIDEIDAHLHPSWQRRIIATLQRHFPNVQIFASTHSPMMVAGLKKGQVHLLKRDATGQVAWSRNERDIIGWTADEIYRKYMEIDDPTDERTARHAEELRELRNKDNLTPEDEARMQELRRLVNEDLLARGALNAQQERFDAMMQEYLRSRASDLSQDGA